MNTEAELVAAVRSGDKNAFNEIIRRFEPLIESTVARFLAIEPFGQSDRDDLFQEASIALYNATMSYDTEQSEVTFGLYAKICLSNSLNSALRRRQRQLAADKAQLVKELPYQYEPEVSDDGFLIRRINSLLSKQESAVFKLYIRGYSTKFIADAIGKSEKSVSNAIFRIRQKISKLL